MNLGFKILSLQRIFYYNFKGEISIYSFFEFSVIYLILYEEVSPSVCLIIWDEIYSIYLNCHVFTPKSKEPKRNGLYFNRILKIQKTGARRSAARVSRSVKGRYIYYENTIR